MHLFKNREDAGQKLAARLKIYEHQSNVIILGLPRGGVVVAYEIAIALDLPLDIICPRKIGAPFNPEFAIGAITESGRGILHREVIESLNISQSYIDEVIKEEVAVANKRLSIYRKNMTDRDFKNKTIIIVDDGLATGATMEAAIESLKGEDIKEIVVAIPVAPEDTLQRIKKLVKECYCLRTFKNFGAVGEFYQHFQQTTDDEVINLLKKSLATHPKR